MASSLSPDDLDDVQEMFAMSFIGVSLATIFYGISFLQTYIYYRYHSAADGLGHKLTVGILWILDSLGTLFVAHSLYTYWILNFNKDPVVDTIVPWSFTSEQLCVTFIAFIAQCFYARLIWKTGGSWFITSVVGVFAVVAFGLGVATTIHLLQIKEVSSIDASSIGGRSFQILSGLVQGLAAFNDVLISAYLCAWLYRKSGVGVWRAGNRFSMSKIADAFLLYIISRGILTAASQLIFLSLNLRYPDETYWVPWHQAVGKLYVNSVLATLNVRSTFQPKQSGATQSSVPQTLAGPANSSVVGVNSEKDLEVAVEEV